MQKIKLDLSNLEQAFPTDFDAEQIATAKTEFLKNLSLEAHKFYQGKVQTIPKAGIFGFNWFNVWYTPGVSEVSTTIRADNDSSFQLSNRGNLVGVVSDSTRVLGDGDCTPPGGLGVMEGKAFLMKYLGGVDATALCIDSKNKEGNPDAQKIIDFVKMVAPSFGAINLEDISQPNCFQVLDTLREECEIPVWHDDAQGTACVTLAGVINALKLAEKELSAARFILMGAGASNTTIARLIITAGGNPDNIIMFDSRGGLHQKRADIKADPRFYRKWELCQSTNPHCIDDIATACQNADVLIALSKPGPHTIKPEWISNMAKRAIVFACANPVPEIYPHQAQKAGAFITATGRGDFPNQVNNSLGFPGILKGALLVKARKITDNMAIAAAKAIAGFAENRGISPTDIVPKMDETEMFPLVAAEVARQAICDGVAREKLDIKEVYNVAQVDIQKARELTDLLQTQGLISSPPPEMLDNALQKAIAKVSKK